MLIVRDRAFYSQNFVELGRTRQFLDSMLSNNPVGILIIDSRGKVIQTNPQLEEMFSLNSQLVIGNNYYNMLEDPILKVLGLDDDIRKALSGRLVERSSVDLFVESRDSSLLIQHLVRPLVVNLKMYPLTDRAGHIFNVVVSFVDITQSTCLISILVSWTKCRALPLWPVA